MKKPVHTSTYDWTEISEQRDFILDTLRHTPSCDGISCTVRQKETPQEEGECPSSYDSKMGDFTAEICSEIEIIRQHYNKDYNLGYFPVSKFQNEFNEHLIIPTVPIESNDENTRIGPFKVLPDPAMQQMKKIQWGICGDRLKYSSHRVGGGRKHNLASEKGEIKANKKELNRKFRNHLNGRFIMFFFRPHPTLKILNPRLN
jgi:hypothetical protein